MPHRDELLDAAATAANRRDAWRAVIITIIGLATVVVASLLVVIGRIYP